MASSVCAFAVSPAPATSFVSPPLYRTSRQWRCVCSARQQKDPVRRLRKGLARFVVVLADEESDVQLGISRKRPPIAKPTTPRHFSTASTQIRHSIAWTCAEECLPSAKGGKGGMRADGGSNAQPERRASHRSTDRRNDRRLQQA